MPNPFQILTFMTLSCRYCRQTFDRAISIQWEDGVYNALRKHTILNINFRDFTSLTMTINYIFSKIYCYNNLP